MGMVATHAKYLASQTFQGLKRRIKDEWNFVLVSAHDAVQGDHEYFIEARVDTDSGSLSVSPCPFGFLATMETQERLTGDSEDRDYVSQVDDENWEHMKQALASLR